MALRRLHGTGRKRGGVQDNVQAWMCALILTCLGVMLLAPVASAQQRPAPADVVLVLDNSGSMRKSDPWFLAAEAVTDFVNGLDGSSRLAVMVFDEEPRLVLPLSALAEHRAQLVTRSLRALDYRGRHSNLATAMERAVYHLRLDGGTDVTKAIVVVTDGRVDTGDAQRDRDLKNWLSQELAQSAAADGIRVFGIAFTERADFQLLQQLAHTTRGEYARAMDLPGLRVALAHLAVLLSHPDEHARADTGDERPPMQEAPVVIPRGPLRRANVARSRTAAERVRGPLYVGLAAGAALVLGLLMTLMRKRRRAMQNQPDAAVVHRAGVLMDRSGVTNTQRHVLGQPVVWVGRSLNQPQTGQASIVINRKTISRRHAIISFRDRGYWIEDQGTPNGTFLNGKRLDGPHRLKDGDRLCFEKFEFEFRSLDEEQTIMVGSLEGEDVTRFGEDALGPTSRGPSTEPRIETSGLGTLS